MLLAAALLGLSVVGPLTPRARSQEPPSRNKPVDHFLTLILTPRGFQGPAARVEEGHIFFAVHNRTFISDLTLHLGAAGGGDVAGVVLPGPVALGRTKPVWRRTVELKPGQYTLRVLEDAKWMISITVVAEGTL